MWQWARRLLGMEEGTAAAAESRPISTAGGTSARTPAARQRIAARYDNAQSTDDNARSWWMVDLLSAKSANSFQVRRQLRLRSRYEVSNNPYLFGVTNGNADDLIGGTGPTLQVTTKDHAYNAQVQRAWNEWAAAVNLTEKLRTCKLARTVDGEGFLVLKTVEDLECSVKLYPCDVEADQVTTPAPANFGELWVDGLVLHPTTGRPTAYHVLRHHPGDYYFPDMNPLRVDKIPARHVIHWFPKFRPGQVRGVPVFTPALDLFSELRAYRKAVLAKVQVSANITAVLQTKAPADITGIDASTVSANTATEPFDALAIDRGMMTTLPWDATLNQFAAPADANTYEMFQEKALGEAIRPLAYPLNLALGTSQKFNFSSAKLDHINYREGLKVERTDCENVVLARLFRAWFEEAIMVPGLLPEGASWERTPHQWHWPGFPTLDAAADTAADISQINAGTMTWRDFWAARGHDWRAVMAQQSAEQKEIEKLGLTFGEPLQKTERLDEEDEDDPDGGGGGGGGKKPPRRAQARQAGNPLEAAYNPDQPRDERGRWGKAADHEERKADAAEKVRRLVDTPASATPKDVAAATDALMRVSKADAKEIQKQHGLKAKGTKKEHAEAIAADAARVVKERESYGRQARANGLDEKHFFAVADQVHDAQTQWHGEVKGMLSEARGLYKSENGKALTNLHKAYRGGDHTDIKGFERIARTMAGRYPGILGAHGYEQAGGDSSEAAARLYDYLYAGAAKPTRAEAYQQALDLTPKKKPASGRPKRSEKKTQHDEEIPFAWGAIIRGAAAAAAYATSAADYLAAMVDALAEGETQRALALRDLALDAGAGPDVEGLGEEPNQAIAARVRAYRDAYVRERVAVVEEADRKAEARRRAASIRGAFDPDQPRDEGGRFGEGGAGGAGSASSEKDRGRERQDDARQDSRDREDSKLGIQRARQDEQTEKQREAEDAQTEKARAKVESARQKEDAQTARQREAEDAKVEAAEERESARLDGAREREDDRTQAARDRDFEKFDARQTAREDRELTQMKEQHEREHEEAEDEEQEKAATARYTAAQAEATARHAQEREQWEAQAQAQHDAEDAETDARRGQEDTDLAERWRAEADARQAARDASDAQRAADRKDQDDEHEEAQADRQDARDAEDAALEAARDREDQEREAARQKEDEELQAQRDAEDEEAQEAEEGEDADVEKRERSHA